MIPQNLAVEMPDLTFLPPDVRVQLEKMNYEYKDALTNAYLWSLHAKGVLEQTILFLTAEMAKAQLALSAPKEISDPWEGEPH